MHESVSIRYTFIKTALLLVLFWGLLILIRFNHYVSLFVVRLNIWKKISNILHLYSAEQQERVIFIGIIVFSFMIAFCLLQIGEIIFKRIMHLKKRTG